MFPGNFGTAENDDGCRCAIRAVLPGEINPKTGKAYLEFEYARLSVAGKIAHVMLRGSILITLGMFVLVVALTVSDIIIMIGTLYDRFFYIMDGWEPQKPPAVRGVR